MSASAAGADVGEVWEDGRVGVGENADGEAEAGAEVKTAASIRACFGLTAAAVGSCSCPCFPVMFIISLEDDTLHGRSRLARDGEDVDLRSPTPRPLAWAALYVNIRPERPHSADFSSLTNRPSCPTTTTTSALWER